MSSINPSGGDEKMSREDTFLDLCFFYIYKNNHPRVWFSFPFEKIIFFIIFNLSIDLKFIRSHIYE
jgi:hypothetical protein